MRAKKTEYVLLYCLNVIFHFYNVTRVHSMVYAMAVCLNTLNRASWFFHIEAVLLFPTIRVLPPELNLFFCYNTLIVASVVNLV